MNIEKATFEIIRDYTDEPMLSLPIDYNTCKPHFHRQMEILYVTEGKNQVQINDTVRVLTKNQMMVADSFDQHSFQSLGDLSICMIIPYSKLNRFISQKNGGQLSTNFILDERISLEFKEILDLLAKYWTNINNPVVDGLIQVFLGLILRYIPITKNNESKNRLLISDILYFIEENFTKNLTLELMAQHFSYSKYYFSKLFNESFHCHFNDYINMVRTQNVIYLVREKGVPVLNAIMDSGFTSVPTFYRYFKLHFGYSINKYLTELKKS